MRWYDRIWSPFLFLFTEFKLKRCPVLLAVIISSRKIRKIILQTGSDNFRLMNDSVKKASPSQAVLSGWEGHAPVFLSLTVTLANHGLESVSSGTWELAGSERVVTPPCDTARAAVWSDLEESRDFGNKKSSFLKQILFNVFDICSRIRFLIRFPSQSRTNNSN